MGPKVWNKLRKFRFELLVSAWSVVHGLITYCLFKSVLGGRLCLLRVWTSWSDLRCARAQEGKEAWPSSQQPVLCWVPRTTSCGHPHRGVCPKNGSRSEDLLKRSAPA